MKNFVNFWIKHCINRLKHIEIVFFSRHLCIIAIFDFQHRILAGPCPDAQLVVLFGDGEEAEIPTGLAVWLPKNLYVRCFADLDTTAAMRAKVRGVSLVFYCFKDSKSQIRSRWMLSPSYSDCFFRTSYRTPVRLFYRSSFSTSIVLGLNTPGIDEGSLIANRMVYRRQKLWTNKMQKCG